MAKWRNSDRKEDFPWDDSYKGETVAELLAKRGKVRSDSLVLAFEIAADSIPEEEINFHERVILAVEAMEMQVNNGGYGQFFVNSSSAYTDVIHEALLAIECEACAAITADAIAALNLPPGYDGDMVSEIADDLSAEQQEELAASDDRYFANDEWIAAQLLDFIERNQDKIRIPWPR